MAAFGVPGTVIGRPGGSLQATEMFGSSGKVGAAGELRTARLLAELAARPGGPSIIHDVRIPITGFAANVDHVVVSGRDITLLDTKVWRGGRYWTLGHTRRGWESVTYADKKTLPTAVDGIRRMLDRMGVPAHFRTSVLVVWPSGDDAPDLTFYRPQQAVAVAASDAPRTVRRLARLTGTRSAHPQVVSALSRILYT